MAVPKTAREGIRSDVRFQSPPKARKTIRASRPAARFRSRLTAGPQQPRRGPATVEGLEAPPCQLRPPARGSPRWRDSDGDSERIATRVAGTRDWLGKQGALKSTHRSRRPSRHPCQHPNWLRLRCRDDPGLDATRTPFKFPQPSPRTLAFG